MKRFQLYKSSNVDWIGEIPLEWEISRVKKYFNERNEKVNDIDFPPLSVTKNGVIPQLDNVSKSDNHEDRKMVCENDFVINSRSDRKGSSGLSNLSGSVSLINIVLQPQKISPKYSEYLFKSKDFVEEFFRNGKGIHWDLWSTRFSELKNIQIPIPPVQDQHQIVQFLDSKTKLIDKLISTKERKINLLKEQRTSLINQVVTKGLSPNVKMKYSGLEWIGEIPEEWNIVPLKILGGFQNGISKGSEFFGHGLPFMNYGDVYKNEITPKDVEGKVDSSDSERNQYSVLRGDIFFTRTSESKDDIGVSSTCLRTIDNCVFSGFVIRFRFYGKTHLPEYSRYHFQTHWKKVFIESKMNIVTRSSLSQQVLGQVPVLIPPIEEQLQIVEFLDSKTKEIDDLVQLEQKKIDLLKEYRQSLISEVVTGKIKVTQ